jgi:hypothetical protein
MTQTYHIHELDDGTRRYLLAVAQRQGRGMPGVYVPVVDALPVVGMILGVILVVGVLALTLPPLDDPLNVAMLQTAGLLLGGWMILAAIRVWVARSQKRNFGYFIWADALRLWETKGYTVAVTELDTLADAGSVDNYQNNTYRNSRVNLVLEHGGYSFTVSQRKYAQQLVGFFQALVGLRESESKPADNLGVLKRGYHARDAAGVRGGQDSAFREEFPALPEPQRAGRAPSGLFACLVIVLLGGVSLYEMHAINVPLRDDAIFDLVQHQRPPALRAYLVDHRNTRHRGEVERSVARFYEAPLSAVKTNAQDAELRDGFVALLTSLQKAVEPLVTIRVKEQRGEFEHADTREQELRKFLINSMKQSIGNDLVEFIEPLSDIAPLIDISYKFVPDKERHQAHRIEYTIQLRARPEEKGISKTFTSQKSWSEEERGNVPREAATEILLAMIGQTHVPAAGAGP